jgi:hypothetical protein
LTHIQCHGALEFHLRLLYEFYEEPHAEAADEKPTEVKAAGGFVYPLPIEPEQNKAENQIRQGLVDLGGVFRLGFSAQSKDESPRQRGYITVNFGIEQIADADKTARKGHCYTEPVHYPKEIKAILLTVTLCKPQHSNQQGNGASMRGQAALPHHEYLQKSFPGAEVIVGLVKNAVP